MKHDIFGRPRFILEANRQKRNSPSAGIELLIFLLVFFIASMAQSVIVTVPETVWLMTGERLQSLMNMAMSGKLDYDALFEMIYNLPPWLVLVSLFATAASIVVVLLFCKLIEKRTPQTLGLIKKHAVTEYLLGAVIGFAMFAAAYGLCAAFQGVRLRGLSITAAGLPMLLTTLLAFLIQGASEEILLRGYLTVSLSKRNSLAFSIAASSIVFGFLHAPNNGFSWLALLNIILMGVLLGVYMVKRGSLWGVCAIHSIWNFVQGNFFGLPVSGLQTGGSVFTSEVISTKQLITGGDFGIEASLPVTMVLLVAITVVCSLKGRDVPPQPEITEI